MKALSCCAIYPLAGGYPHDSADPKKLRFSQRETTTH
jgi:hypothetical protein